MKRILIIEDDKSISELQKDYLEMSGYKVVCAFDGDSGLGYIKNEDFDLSGGSVVEYKKVLSLI